MDSFYNFDELCELGLASFGQNVKISRKASIYGAEKISIGSNVRIDDFCILSGKIKLGNYIHISAYTALYGGAEGITLEDFVSISSHSSVFSTNDDYSGQSLTNPMVPEQYKCNESKPVHIEKHVIIGSTSVILPGVVLHEGSCFGLSLINHDSQAWSVNIGIPSKKIKERSKGLLDLEEAMNGRK